MRLFQEQMDQMKEQQRKESAKGEQIFNFFGYLFFTTAQMQRENHHSTPTATAIAIPDEDELDWAASFLLTFFMFFNSSVYRTYFYTNLSILFLRPKNSIWLQLLPLLPRVRVWHLICFSLNV